MNSRYEILEILYSRKDHSVLKALDQISLKECLIKSVRKDASLQRVHAFWQEVRVLSELSDPRFPRLLDVQEEENSLYLAESYFDAPTLREWLQSNPSRKNRKDVWIQIIRLIQKVHQAGYLYLDLKEDNILIHNNQPVLIDFNSCITLHSSRLQATNPNACPQEWLTNKALDERADQVGLGRVYESLFRKCFLSKKCTRPNPENRFRNLDELIAVSQKKHRNKPKPAVCAAFCLALLLCLRPIASISSQSSSLYQERQQLAVKLKDASEEDLFDLLLGLDTESVWLQDPGCWQMIASSVLESGHSSLILLLSGMTQSSVMEKAGIYGLWMQWKTGMKEGEEFYASALQTALVSSRPEQVIKDFCTMVLCENRLLPGADFQSFQQCVQSLVKPDTQLMELILQTVLYWQSCQEVVFELPFSWNDPCNQYEKLKEMKSLILTQNTRILQKQKNKESNS